MTAQLNSVSHQPMPADKQHTPYHKYDVYTHSVKATVAADKGDKMLRLAAFFHDIGKPSCFVTDENGVGHFYGHAKVSAELAAETLLQLKAPTALRERVCLLIEQHMVPSAKPEVRKKGRKQLSY